MDRFETLASDYFDGVLQPKDAAELAAILRSEPRKKQWFLEMYQQSRLLSVELSPSSEEDLAKKILGEIEGDTGQFVNSVMRRVEVPGARPERKAGRTRPGPPPVGRRFSWKGRVLLAAGAAALLLGLGYAFFHSSSPELPPISARLERLTGEVSVTTPARSTRRVRPGDQIGPGETLDTIGPASSAILFYADRTRVELRGDASVRFQPESRGAGGKSLQIHRGLLLAEVSKQPPELPFLVLSRFAETRVVGTRFELWADAESTRLDVTEGRVRFVREGESKVPQSPGVEVGAGERAVATARDIVRWVPVCDLDFSQMKNLPPQMEAVFCSSRVLHTTERKIEPGSERVRFENGGLVFDPTPGPNRDHGLVVARWKEAIGDDVVIEAGVAGGALWSLGFALSGDSFDGYRVVFAPRDNPTGGIFIDTISPVAFLPLASDPRPIACEKDHVLRAEKRGNRIKVWVDRELRLDAEIGHALSDGRRRSFAISNYGESPVVRSLRVWKAGSP